jgi:hypothetical protein
MRVSLTNESTEIGHFLVEDVDHDDDERPPKVREIAAGASLEVHVSQRGVLHVFGFNARVVPVPKRIRMPEKPPQTKARGKR